MHTPLSCDMAVLPQPHDSNVFSAPSMRFPSANQMLSDVPRTDALTQVHVDLSLILHHTGGARPGGHRARRVRHT